MKVTLITAKITSMVERSCIARQVLVSTKWIAIHNKLAKVAKHRIVEIKTTVGNETTIPLQSAGFSRWKSVFTHLAALRCVFTRVPSTIIEVKPPMDKAMRMMVQPRT